MSDLFIQGLSATADALCDRFEEALQRGESPRIEAWLQQAGENANSELVAELAALDLDYGLRAGQRLSAGDFFTRFPELRENVSIAMRLVAIEFHALQRCTPPVGSLETGLAPTQALAPTDFSRRYADLARLPEWQQGPWNSSTDADPTSKPFDPVEFLKGILDPPQSPQDLGVLAAFQVQGVIGKGGMGVVVRAVDSLLCRTIAIKIMLPGAATHGGAADRFLREARLAASVHHPRVVPIYQVGTWRETPFLVMPLLSGHSLGRHLRGGLLAPLEAARIARGAAEGLAAAHALELTHRDIKPDNIWLEDTPDGTSVRLLDFGLARCRKETSLTLPGMVVGTPNYVAPEQAEGKPIDGRADLFGLGCVLYEMLTGRQAFPGNQILTVLNAIANQVPQPPRELRADVPVELSALTMRLLEKNPQQRPDSAEWVANELRRIEDQIVSEADGAPVTRECRPAIQNQSNRTSNQRNVVRDLGRFWPLALSALLCLLASCGVYWGVSKALWRHEPLKIEALEVQHFERTSQGEIARGALGQQSFSPKLGDLVQVKAQLSRPAYSYVIVFRPDGVADLCYPADEDTPPPLSDSPRYPLTDGKQAYGLSEGEGLWVFVAVSSDEPLPPFREWFAQHSHAASLWQPLLAVPAGIAWWDDGFAAIEHRSAAGTISTLRSKDETVGGPAAAIRNLTNSLRDSRKQATSVAAVGFTVTKLKESP